MPVVLSPGAFGTSPEVLALQARSGDQRAAERVAGDFESLFVSLVLKELRQTLEPDSLFAGDPSDSLGSLFDMFLGQHITKAGGFGVADMVKRYLEAR
jgi:flagellar protein FlgJ